MPKNIDYSKGLIYKLCCKNPEIADCYVGSTTNFIRRKQEHKSCCNNENNKDYNYYVYQVIRDKGGFQNWDMIQIEEYKASNKKELETRERYWIESLKSSLNQIIPTRTQKEYYEDNKEDLLLKVKEYREKNRDAILLKKKQYQIDNKDVIKLRDKARKKEKYTCECGSTLRIIDKARHERTHKHQAFIKTLIKP
jgi:hypothetical protein